MSSNIRMTKICEYCKNRFEAKTVLTRYCSHRCNQRGYKQIKKDEKLSRATKTEQLEPTGILRNSFDYPSIKGKEWLTIKETSALLNITHVTLRRWLKNGIIVSSKIGKKHLIKRSLLEHLLK